MQTLDMLPLEITFQILDCVASPHNPSLTPFHPLNSLAATSKHFDSAVEEYTRALLKRHANLAPKKSKTYTSRRKWLAEICQFCYKKSKRRSTMWQYLTCCLACDKKHFPRVTMTNAINQYGLSKLDLFTPNRLHPSLPPLAHGENPSMGSAATLIYEPDLVARRDHIHGQLSDADRLDANLRKRSRRHDRLIMHMKVSYCNRRKIWYHYRPMQKKGEEKPCRASMKTQESRDEFVQKGLKQEWAAMGAKGASEDTAIALD